MYNSQSWEDRVGRELGVHEIETLNGFIVCLAGFLKYYQTQWSAFLSKVNYRLSEQLKFE